MLSTSVSYSGLFFLGGNFLEFHNAFTTQENLNLFWIAIAEFGVGIMRRLCLDPIKLFL